MWRITRTMMKRDARMMMPAGLAIVIGTIFMCLTLLFGNVANASMRREISMDAGQANYAVTSRRDLDKPILLDEFDGKGLSKLRGVSGLRPDVDLMVDTEANGQSSKGILAIVSARQELMPVDLARGQWPDSDDQVVLPHSVANRLQAGLGDKVRLHLSPLMLPGSDSDSAQDSSSKERLVDRGTVDLTISGISKSHGGKYDDFGGAVVLTGSRIERLLSMAGMVGPESLPVGNIYLQVDGQGKELQNTLQNISPYVPDGYQLEDRRAMEDRLLSEQTGNGVNIMTVFLMTFGVLAMVVAALVIANTFQIMVARQRRYLALLRVIGADRWQIRAGVLQQALFIGVISSLVGILLAMGLMGLAGCLGLHSGTMKLELLLTPTALLVPFVLGVLATLVAAFGSTRTAIRVRPLEALQPLDHQEQGSRKRTGLWISILLAVSGLVFVIWSSWRVTELVRTNSGDTVQTSNQQELLLGLAVLGVLLIFLGALMGARRWIPALLRCLGGPVSRIGPSCRVGVANIARNPSRVAATGVALLIGVTLVSTLATGAVTTKRTLAKDIDQRYSLDIEISGQGLNKNNVRAIQRIQGVADAELVQRFNAEVESGGPSQDSMTVYALDTPRIRRVLHGDLGPGMQRSDALLVSTRTISKHSGYRDGSQLKLLIADPQADDERGKEADARRTLTGVFAGFGGLDTSGVYAITDSQNVAGIDTKTHEIWIRTQGDRDAALLLDDIRQAVGEHDDMAMSGGLTQKRIWGERIDSLLAIMVALLGVAVIIALIGVSNTLMMSVLERRRETATLRAIGMSSVQVRRSLGVEACMIALGASLAGMVLGTLFGWIGAYQVFVSLGSVTCTVPWSAFALILPVALLAAVVASVLPAREAVKVSPIEALSDD
ncbi:ABC transporter permease [Bifidobacterium sp. H6bp22N]|uniref:ABC transporter permease n=1 Tax=Bifidobacterium polysaccharolyticum TaxID=2750967 RepID=UPI0028BE2A88|nr:ABC transporter permease [Bifidobacterium sp. H6bp22N]MDT7508088.1 ABC transporter permease [Bifidobacterium sp. H6bp22N]